MDLKAHREALGFTQKRLADALHVSQAAISKWENPRTGEKPPWLYRQVMKNWLLRAIVLRTVPEQVPVIQGLKARMMAVGLSSRDAAMAANEAIDYFVAITQGREDAHPYRARNDDKPERLLEGAAKGGTAKKRENLGIEPLTAKEQGVIAARAVAAAEYRKTQRMRGGVIHTDEDGTEYFNDEWEDPLDSHGKVADR